MCGAVTSNSNSTGYRIAGGRTGVLLIHGLCGSPTEMRFVANGLARAGYTVHVPVLAGHGGTTDELRDATWQDWVASAEAALDDISKECDHVIVAGLSTGAVIALLLAARHPGKVQALALYSPTLWLNGFQIPWYARLFRLVTFKAFANLINFPAPHKFGIKCPRIRDFLHKALATGDGPKLPVMTPGGAVLERRWLVDAARRVLGRVDQPVLIMHPREDDYAALDNATYLERNLKGMVDLVVLDDSYHIVTVDRQRQVVLDRPQAFVARVAESLGAGFNSAQKAA
jgi:carboxylesterase